MTTKRISINAWGRGIDKLELPSYAIQQDGESPEEAVARSIARATKLEWCGGPRPDGMSLPEKNRHFQGTLGSPCSGGGWSPEAELWFSIAAEHYELGADLVSIDEYAESHGVHKNTVRNWILRGLKHERFGGRVRIPRDATPPELGSAKAPYKIHRQAGCGLGRYVVVEGTSSTLRTGVFSSRDPDEAVREASRWLAPATVAVLDTETWTEIGEG